MSNKNYRYRLFLFSIIISAFIFNHGIYSMVRDYGFYINYGFLTNFTDFKSLINVPRPDLPLTKSNQPGNINIGLLFNYKIYDEFFLGFRAGYNHYVLDFQDFEPTTFSNDGHPIAGIIQHDLTTSYNNLSLEVSIGFKFLNALDFQLGLNTITPFKTNYSQSEQIIKPTNYQYSRPVGDYSGSVPSATNLVYLPFGRIRLNSEILTYKKWCVVPELEYKKTYNDLVSGLSWKYSSLSLGVTISYNNDKEKISDFHDSVYVRDTITTFSMLDKDTSIKLLSQKTSMEKVQDEKISYWKVIIHEQYSLIKQKPKSILNGELTTLFITKDLETTSMLEISYNEETSEVYYPGFSVNDGRKSYSNKFRNDILTNNSLEIPNIRFIPQVISEAGLDKWEINIYLKDVLLKSISGRGDVPPEIDFDLSEFIHTVNLEGKKLRYEFVITDIDKQTLKANSGEISIKGIKNNVRKTFSKIVIIPFDYEYSNEILNNFSGIISNKKAVIYYNTKNYSTRKKQIDEINNFFKIDKRQGMSDDEFKKFIPVQFSSDDVFIIYLD